MEVIESFEDLSAYAEAWNRLASETPVKMPMLSYAWAVSFMENPYERIEKCCFFLAFDADRLVGVLPLFVICRKHFGLSFHDLKPPFHSGLLAAAGTESEVIQAMLEAVDRVIPDWFSITMNLIPEQSPLLEVFRRQSAMYHSFLDLDGKCSYNSIEGDYEQFHAKLGHNFRKNLRKANKKLASLNGVEACFLTGSDAKSEQLDNFMAIEVTGYKGREGGNAIIHSPARVACKRALTRRLGELGWLEWHMLNAEGKTIAMDLAAKMGGTLFLFKVAYDEAYAECAPGNLLAERMFERAFLTGETAEVNWMSDLPWHENWRVQKRDYYLVQIFPRRALPFLLGYVARKIRTSLGQSRIIGPPLRTIRAFFNR